MKQASRNIWLDAVKAGLLGGIVALILGLIGMVEVSLGRPVIYGVLTMGHTLLLLPYFWASYRAVRQVQATPGQPSRAAMVGSGALAGLVTSSALAALVLLGSTVNLRTVFINASPVLFDTLTLKLGTAAGLPLLLVGGAVLGGLIAGIFLLPTAMRRALALGLGAVPAISIMASALFAQRGLTPAGAGIVFVLSIAGSYVWSTMQGQVKRRVGALPPTQRRALGWARWGLFILIVLALPATGRYPSEVMDNVALYVLMGLGLNIVVGFAGLLDLGYVAFFALGAYTMGVLTSPEIGWLGFHLTFWQALPFAVIVATSAGVLLGIPVLGMRGDYLAIVTLGFGEIIRLVALSDWLKPKIGGSNGITLIPKAEIGSFAFSTPQSLYYLLLLGCIIAAFVAIRVKNSRLGRAWMAMREDEDVAQAMGIDLIRTKLMAFATGAAFSGLSGAIFASKLASIYPHSFHILVSFNALAVIIVGGMGSIPGVIVGSLVMIGLPELLREFSEYRLLVLGAALVFMMLNRPEGLLPEARRKLELHEADTLDVDAATELRVPPQEPSANVVGSAGQ